MSKTRRKRRQTSEAERGEPSSAKDEARGEVPVPYSKTESTPEGIESEGTDVGEQEFDAEKMRSGEEDLNSGGSEEGGAKELQIRILPLWAWGLVMIVSFLIAFWVVSTYVLGAP